MRFLTSLAVIVCAFAAYNCQSHDLVIGQPGYGDVVLWKVNEYKYGFPLFVRSSEIDFPETGIINFAYIKAIIIKDNYHDNSGGYATIKAGGIGQRFVRIKLKSQRGSGFNFTVTIYGRY